jgi:hypothetical protein
MLYNIGGLWLYFEGNNPYFVERCKVFQKDPAEKKPEDCDIRVSMKLSRALRKPSGALLDGIKDAALLHKKPPLEGYYLYSSLLTLENEKLKRNGIPSVLDANPDWSNIIIKYIPDDSTKYYNPDGSSVNWNEFSSFLSAGIAFRYMLIKKGGLQIHSSSLEYKGKGLIFSAPSGTGKSTHTGLWKELYKDDVIILNDDRPAIRYIDGAPMLCGTPWSGSSDSFANKIVPLNCIVMLEQAPVNSIEKLTGQKILQMLMPRCFLPYFDQALMNDSMDTLEKLIKDVSVYLLKCRPDYEAVELVRQCLS